MKAQSKNIVFTALLMANVGLISINASAGQDESQRYMIQQAIKAKQARAVEAGQQQASSAQAEDCQGHMKKQRQDHKNTN